MLCVQMLWPLSDTHSYILHIISKYFKSMEKDTLQSGGQDLELLNCTLNFNP